MKYKIKLNASKINNNFKLKENNINNITIKQTNYYHILKSFLCCKDKNTKIINFCYEIINKEY